MARQAGAVLAVLFLAHAAAAQFIQQGSKLVGTGSVGRSGATQGTSVAISGDGNTAIVGGPQDNLDANLHSTGAAWVFTRSGGVWSQQGSKLVGSDAVGPARQGASVAISADGNTVIVGGPPDNGAWVFTRSGEVWSQQGSKLVGTDGSGEQGSSVAISGDGNTAIVGGPYDNSGAGAAWVFTRSGSVWSQQGDKLVGTGAVGAANEGNAVAISADGTTAIIGGPGDNPGADGRGTGAAWVFTRSGGVWSQQGSKLVGTGAVGDALQGFSVAISGDGNTAIIGGPPDTGFAGAAWVFTRSEGVWSQQGPKLGGTGAVPRAAQGQSVAISADGNTAIVGGGNDNGRVGAAWVFTRSEGVWSQLGSKLVGSETVGAANQGLSVAISGDGTTAIVGGPYDNGLTGATWVFTASVFRSWVPVAAHNAGLNHSQWRSDLDLLNSGDQRANVQITFFGSSGAAANTTYVPPGVQSVLTDVVGQLGGTGQGALEILSDRPLKVTSRTYNRVPSDASCYPNGTLGQDYPTVSEGQGLNTSQSAYLSGLVENSAYRTNIGLVNVGSAPATVLVDLYDGAGTKLTSYTVPLTSGQWAQETQPFKNKAGQTAMDRGYAKVTIQSGSGVFAFASVMDNLTNDPTTVIMQR